MYRAVWPVCSQSHIGSVALSSHLGLLTMVTFVVYIGVRSLQTDFLAHLRLAPLWPAETGDVITRSSASLSKRSTCPLNDLSFHHQGHIST